MKILILSDKIPWPANSGGALAVGAIVNGMLSARTELSLLAIESSKHLHDNKKIPETISNRIDIHTVYVNTVINPIELVISFFFSAIPYNIKRFRSRKLQNKLCKLLGNKDYDIIQIEGMNLAPYIPVIRNHSTALISLRTHNVENEIWRGMAASTINPLKKIYFRSLARKIRKYEIRSAASCDMLVSISKTDLKFFRDAGVFIPSYMVPYGIDKLPEAGRSNENTNMLAYIGSLDWRPNQEGLLWMVKNIWKELRCEHPDIVLRIAGRDAPQWLVRKLNLPGIEFAGEVENADEFISQCTILLVPLLAGSGMRIRIVQAMAMGKAVVTTTTGAGGMEVINREHLLIANEPHEFRKQVSMLIRNKRMLDKIQVNSHNYIMDKHLNKDNIAGLMKFYNEQLI